MHPKYSHPICNLTVCHTYARKTLSVFTETIFKDITITCSSAQGILLASLSLGFCSSRCFRLGLPIMSKGTKQMTLSAWYSIHWGEKKGDSIDPWATQAPAKRQSILEPQHIWNLICVNQCTTHGAWEAHLGFPPFMFSASSLTPESLIHG